MLEEKIKCKEEKKSGGSVVKSPPVDAADTGSIPAQGTKIPCVSGQLSSSATARNARAPQLERRSCAATKSQCNQINKYLKIGKKKKARTREMTRCFGAEKEWCEVGMFVCLYVLCLCGCGVLCMHCVCCVCVCCPAPLINKLQRVISQADGLPSHPFLSLSCLCLPLFSSDHRGLPIIPVPNWLVG